MDLGLSGLRVLVTGASRRLGFATAQAKGVRVALNSRSVDKLRTATDRLGAGNRKQGK